VRQALGGLADATGLSGPDLDDIGLAMTEACNNASAYGYDGAEGLLQVELQRCERGMLVTVRDHGVGLGVDVGRAEFPTDVNGELAGIGLPSIQGLADEAHWTEPSGGGTSVQMRFSTAPLAWDGDGKLDDLERVAIDEADLACTIEVGMAPMAVAHGVLPRLVRAVAAQARFSIDRHSAIQRVVSALLADRSCWIATGAMQARLAARESWMELAVGPVQPADACRLAEAVGPIAPRLSTGVLALDGGGQRVVVRFER
jgi:serine/threonine-protein kinase RsbW